METKTDWNILLQGYMSLLWCYDSIDPVNEEKKVKDLLSVFKQKYQNVSPLNIGSLLAASYLCFVYPQQSEFNVFNFDSISTDHFKIVVGNEKKSKDICRRIRNSLTHARFNIENKDIVFHDQEPDGSNKFEAKIEIDYFGDFINQFFFAAKNQYFNRGKA